MNSHWRGLPSAFVVCASQLLFVYFGVKLLKEAKDSDGGPSDELQEAEESLRAKKDEHGQDDDEGPMSPTRKGSAADVERGGMFQSSTSPSVTSPKSAQLFGKNAVKVFTQACTVTFLAEWGDRSQIATIAMAAAHEPMGVVVGGLVGHALCTGIAVVGGRMLAAKISERTVALVGGVLFIVFALHSLYVGPQVEAA
jgi:putative Ca2+/H+ antiporter (TMEM165/GDT1 family)